MAKLARFLSALAFCIFAGGSPLAVAAFSDLIVFGDSLTDSGNVHAFSTTVDALDGTDHFPTTPPDAYFAGRFSDGYNFADRLHQSMFGGSNGLTPTLLGGNNFAVGGATTGTGNIVDPLFPGLPPTGLQSQVTTFTNRLSGQPADRNALYLVYGGSNDMLSMLEAAEDDPLNALNLRDAAIGTAIGNLQTVLAGLAAAGAQHFLIPNVADLGSTPRVAGTLGQSFARAASEQYNDALAALILGFDAQPGVDARSLDVFGLFDEAIANPSRFGFSDVSTACYPGTPFTPPSGAPCSNADQHLFWDDVHPSTRAHGILANAAYAVVIPEPQTWLVVLLGLLVICTKAMGSHTRRP